MVSKIVMLDVITTVWLAYLLTKPLNIEEQNSARPNEMLAYSFWPSNALD